MPRTSTTSSPQPSGRNPSASEALGPDGRIEPGKLHEIPARQGRALRVATGQIMQIVNTHGSQVGDFWCFADGDMTEFLSMEHLRTGLRRLSPGQGDGLISNRRRPIMTLLEDSSPGVHDTLVAACDSRRYTQLGHEGYHDNCADNLLMALSAIGLRAPEIPAPLNLWMNIPVEEGGAMSWQAPVSRPGDFVRLKAEIDAIAVISCCPMDLLPINGEDARPKSLGIMLET
ncbi:DUF1989 domain-containing protein [Paracoccus saliphilus]|uniref:Urea carboxylase-associated family protein n=1 Tax=Paracoccus saliphilus TaxID=405559 RepID=A0AA45W8J7_9RHOB|nr:urea carboxylase-associated family protein [Paracoccus saliphilus]WCR02666.1 urea carboxylase-associated family protein [Paracoccus saliphilus]SIT17433.1 hypothetical protein SAMN05421772_13112 [Paracoccus saliphilus]